MCLIGNDDWEDFDEIVPDDVSSDNEHFIREAQREGENSAYSLIRSFFLLLRNIYISLINIIPGVL
jgi:hypothetical protein